MKHFKIFQDRVYGIFNWNDPKHQATVTYTKGINRFTDLSDEERRNYVMPETKMEVRLFLKNLYHLI
jgi:hypothetical protein